MKKKFAPFVLLLLALLAASCNKDDGSLTGYDEPTIYSSTDRILFSEVIIYFRPYLLDADGVRRYIVTDQLHNIALQINNKEWSIASSYSLDTTHVFNKEIIGGYVTTKQAVTYAAVANLRITQKPSTAGGYSDLLNKYTNLQPGHYVCQIKSMQLQTPQKEMRTVYTPTLVAPLDVTENTISSNLGVFDVQIQ